MLTTFFGKNRSTLTIRVVATALVSTGVAYWLHIGKLDSSAVWTGLALLVSLFLSTTPFRNLWVHKEAYYGYGIFWLLFPMGGYFFHPLELLIALMLVESVSYFSLAYIKTRRNISPVNSGTLAGLVFLVSEEWGAALFVLAVLMMGLALVDFLKTLLVFTVAFAIPLGIYSLLNVMWEWSDPLSFPSLVTDRGWILTDLWSIAGILLLTSMEGLRSVARANQVSRVRSLYGIVIAPLGLAALFIHNTPITWIVVIYVLLFQVSNAIHYTHRKIWVDIFLILHILLTAFLIWWQ